MLDRRARTIIELLEQLHELTDPVRAGNGDGQTGLLLMPHAKDCKLLAREHPGRASSLRDPRVCTCHMRAVAEVERLLRVMRDDRHTSLLELPDGERVSLRACWWHLNERYLRCQSSTRELTWRSGKWQGLSHGSVAAQPGGWQVAFAKEAAAKRRRGAQIRVRVVTWDPGVRLPVVERGVEWLSSSWAIGVEPMLPRMAVAA